MRNELDKPSEYVDLGTLNRLGFEGIEASRKQIDQNDLHELLEADMPDPPLKIALKYGVHLSGGEPELKYDLKIGESENRRRISEQLHRNAVGYLDLRRLMLDAIALKELAGKEFISKRDLMMARIFVADGGAFQHVDRAIADLQLSRIEQRDGEGNNVFLEYEKAMIPQAFDYPRYISGNYLTSDDSAYARHLEKGLAQLNELGRIGFPAGKPEMVLDGRRGKTFHFHLLYGSFPETQDGRRRAVFSVLDNLFAANLYDVRTVTTRGVIQQDCGSVYSTFWLLLSRELEGGRAMRCKVCGKPIVAIGERGKMRLYCGQACRKWAQRHPGKTRSTWRVE